MFKDLSNLQRDLKQYIWLCELLIDYFVRNIPKTNDLPANQIIFRHSKQQQQGLSKNK